MNKPVCPKCGKHEYVVRLRNLTETKVEYACLDRPFMGFRGCGQRWEAEINNRPGDESDRSTG